MNPMVGWILLGYFLLAGNIAAEKWLLASYDFKEINFITAAVIMGLTAFQEFAQHRSFDRLKPVHWPSLLLLSFCTLIAWNCYLYSLLGLSLFEFGAIGLLSPVVMACLAIPILRERPSRWLWFALLLGLTGGFFSGQGRLERTWGMALPCGDVSGIGLCFTAMDFGQELRRSHSSTSTDFLGTPAGSDNNGADY